MKKIENAKAVLFCEKTAAKRFENILREKFRKLSHKESADKFDEKIEELGSYLSKYVRYAGEKRVILDFQTGLNLLNGYKKYSFLKAKEELKEDSEFGEKTYAALINILNNYDIDTVKRYIKLGAVNNELQLSKNDKNTDTDAKISEILQML